MSSDVRSVRPNAEAIAITRLESGTEQDKSVRNALDMLRDGKVKLVNWLLNHEREEFLHQRIAAANSPE